MGAEQFHSSSAKEDVATAFQTCVEDAAWEYGHGGYTGTIAEKSGYVIFTPPADKSIDDILVALENSWDSHATLPDWLPQHVADTYDDKWGPAVAIHMEDGWHFIGWASS